MFLSCWIDHQPLSIPKIFSPSLSVKRMKGFEQIKTFFLSLSHSYQRLEEDDDIFFLSFSFIFIFSRKKEGFPPFSSLAIHLSPAIRLPFGSSVASSFSFFNSHAMRYQKNGSTQKTLLPLSLVPRSRLTLWTLEKRFLSTLLLLSLLIGGLDLTRSSAATAAALLF